MAVKVGLKFIEIWGDSMEDAVREYEKEEIQTGKIVFYGPSNYTRWSAKYGMKPMADVLLGKSGEKCVINRGFGSSCSEHQLYYYDRMVRPLKPKVLVYTFFFRLLCGGELGACAESNCLRENGFPRYQDIPHRRSQDTKAVELLRGAERAPLQLAPSEFCRRYA